MRAALKQMIFIVALGLVFCLAGIWWLQTRASDFWGYGKLGVSDGGQGSPVYYIEVRGVGATPTIARIVRFVDPSAAPKNALAVSHAVVPEFDSHVQNVDRWNGRCTLLVGQTLDEKIEIPLDAAAARELFAQPGKRFDSFEECESLWSKHIAVHVASKQQSIGATHSSLKGSFPQPRPKAWVFSFQPWRP